MRQGKEGEGRKRFPMTLGGSGRPNVAHGEIAKLTEGLGVAAAFRAVVDTIVVANRELTAWEADASTLRFVSLRSVAKRMPDAGYVSR